MVTQTRSRAGRSTRDQRKGRTASSKKRTSAVATRTASKRCEPRATARHETPAAEAPARDWPSSRQLRPGSETEAALVEQYVPLVKSVVGRLAMTLPPHVDGEDLYSAGLSGLLNAIRKYNPRAGTAFETYARLRIRGAVFDELRRMDWVPRSVHTKARRVQAAMHAIEQQKGRTATEEEIATALKVPLQEYRQWIEEIRPATFICLDAAFNNSEFDDGSSQYESLADQRQENPLDGTFRREVAQFIAERLKALPEMQRKVLALYYFEDMRLREIAESFDLTESRICQIHAQAILAIKSQLTKFDPLFA
jgi:RNA polymerase sigma factor for flagellar operon FliA